MGSRGTTKGGHQGGVLQVGGDVTICPQRWKRGVSLQKDTPLRGKDYRPLHIDRYPSEGQTTVGEGSVIRNRYPLRGR